MEPVLLTNEFVQKLSGLRSADRKLLYAELGKFAGAEFTERGWFVNVHDLKLAKTAADWRKRYARDAQHP